MTLVGTAAALGAPVTLGRVVTHPAGTIVLPPRRGVRQTAVHWWDRLWFHRARQLVLPLAGLSVISAVGTACSPALLQWPLLLVLLSPRMLFLSLAANDVHWSLFLLVGTFRLSLGDPFHFLLGRTCGSGAVDRLPGFLRRFVERSSHLQRPLVAAVVLVRPIGLYLAWAGSLGLHPRLIAALDLIGTVTYLLLLRAGASAVLG
jgi:hypothetical protein